MAFAKFVWKMTAGMLLLLTFLEIVISTGSLPRLTQCRITFKGREGKMHHSFAAGESCMASVTVPVTQNITDPRDCLNYYKCIGLSCWQCPCPANTTFNPVTLQCDTSRAPCQCSHTTTTTSTTTSFSTSATPEEIMVQSTGAEYVISPAASPNEGPQANSQNGVVIIVVIVVATVVILGALIIGFCMWQRGMLPSRKALSAHNQSSNGGYLHTLPPQERHVYAEIDENAVARERQIRELEESRRQLPHIYTPPFSLNPPSKCIHHPHETFTLPPGYPHRLNSHMSFHSHPPGDNRDLMSFSSTPVENKLHFNQNNNFNSHLCSAADTSSMTSCSGCSHCSGISTTTPVEGAAAIDRRTLLNTDYGHTVIGKHVYI